jgi:hypothetical protein
MKAGIYLSQMTTYGLTLGTRKVSGLVTSFSSKSELALNLSPDGKTVTFMGYDTKAGNVDVSNSNTPGVVDPTNPVPSAYYRAAAQLSSNGKIAVTDTNAYSGNNGRAAITAQAGGKELIYTAGNAGNGGNPQPNGVILGAGAQLIVPGVTSWVSCGRRCRPDHCRWPPRWPGGRRQWPGPMGTCGWTCARTGCCCRQAPPRLAR